MHRTCGEPNKIEANRIDRRQPKIKLNGPLQVRAALGVPLDSYYFSNGNFNYSEITPDTAPFHIRAVRAGLRVLAYQGRSDAFA